MTSLDPLRGTPAWGAGEGPLLSVSAPRLTGALCAEIGGDGWFPEKGESIAQVRAICAECPARLPCLQWAIDHEEQHGIWGGLSLAERRRLHKRRAA